ncbi:SIR2 family protein [Bacillus pacificus]
MTEGWARRFLVDLFSNYTVLFVGYSHNDPVMKYLANWFTTKYKALCICRTRRKYISLGAFRNTADCISE